MANPNPRRRRRAPRAATTYRHRAHGTQNYSGTAPGDMTVVSHIQVRIEKPPGGQENKPLWFRPWPQLSDENPEEEVQQFRFSEEPQDITDWLRRVPVADFAGSVPKERLTFLLYDPVWETTIGYQPSKENPYLVALRVLKNAKKKGKSQSGHRWNPDWSELVDNEGDLQMNAWPKQKQFYFCQGHVMQNGKEIYTGGAGKKPLGLNPGDPLVLIRLSGSAGQALCGMADLMKDDIPQDTAEDDWEVRCKYGDFVGLDTGRFVAAYHPDRFTQFDEKGGGTSVAEGLEPDRDPSFSRGWQVAIRKKYKDPKNPDKLWTPAMEPADQDVLFNKSERWDDLFNFGQGPDTDPNEDPTVRIERWHNMMVIFMAKAYRNQPKMLEYAWMDHEEFMTADVKGILAARTQATVPSNLDEEESEADRQASHARRTAGRRNTDRAAVPAGDPDDFDDDDDYVDPDDDDGDADFDDEPPADTAEEPAADEATEPAPAAEVEAEGDEEGDDVESIKVGERLLHERLGAVTVRLISKNGTKVTVETEDGETETVPVSDFYEPANDGEGEEAAEAPEAAAASTQPAAPADEFADEDGDEEFNDKHPEAAPAVAAPKRTRRTTAPATAPPAAGSALHASIDESKAKARKDADAAKAKAGKATPAEAPAATAPKKSTTRRRRSS